MSDGHYLGDYAGWRQAGDESGKVQFRHVANSPVNDVGGCRDAVSLHCDWLVDFGDPQLTEDGFGVILVLKRYFGTSH